MKKLKRPTKLKIMGVEHKIKYAKEVPDDPKAHSLYDGLNKTIWITAKDDEGVLREICHEVSHARSNLGFDSELPAMTEAVLASLDEYVYSELIKIFLK